MRPHFPGVCTNLKKHFSHFWRFRSWHLIKTIASHLYCCLHSLCVNKTKIKLSRNIFSSHFFCRNVLSKWFRCIIPCDCKTINVSKFYSIKIEMFTFAYILSEVTLKWTVFYFFCLGLDNVVLNESVALSSICLISNYFDRHNINFGCWIYFSLKNDK
jgi:hypothetical protein